MSQRVKFRALPTQLGAKGHLRLQAFVWLCLSRTALWLLPFRLVVAMMQRLPSLWALELKTPRQVARSLEAAARYVPHATCLVRALAGARLFSSKGHAVLLVIGVRKNAGSVEAHAWLELDGHIVVGNVVDLYSYQPLSRTQW